MDAKDLLCRNSASIAQPRLRMQGGNVAVSAFNKNKLFFLIKMSVNKNKIHCVIPSIKYANNVEFHQA